MTAAAGTLPAGCAAHLRTRAAAAYPHPHPHPTSPPGKPARYSRTGQPRPFPPFRRGLDPAGRPRYPAQSELLGAPRQSTTDGARESWGSPAARRSPRYVPVPAFPLQLLSGLESPARSRPPPSPARPRPLPYARPDVGRSLAGHWLGPLFQADF